MEMIVHYPYLQDKDFLKQIDKIFLQERYVKITLLDFQTEKKIKNLEGIITGGSLSKDGSSAARVSCSLNCTVNGFEYDMYTTKSDYSIGKKIFLEIGVKNDTSNYKDYPILWFPQGVMIITEFSMSAASTGALSISIKLKDKISLLDGTIGGMLPATTRFDQTLDIVKGQQVEKKVPVRQIIQEAVNHFGGEQYSNILVDDVPEKARRALKWNDSTPLWIIWQDVIINNQIERQYEVRRQDDLATVNPGRYGGRCFKSGYDVGYVYEDFVYDKELTLDAGSTVTQLLDTLKQWLGNYEYFYDEFGVFHFQEIKNYLNTSKSTYEWTKNFSDEDYSYDPVGGDVAYSFTDSSNITSFSVSPQYQNIKNDYVIIGKNGNNGGNIIYHFAIDKKPQLNKTGYSNILVYKDAVTNNYTLAAPQILSDTETLPIVGDIGVIYGKLDVNKELKVTRKASSPADFRSADGAITESITVENNSTIYDNLTPADSNDLNSIKSDIDTFINNPYAAKETLLVETIEAFFLELYKNNISNPIGFFNGTLEWQKSFISKLASQAENTSLAKELREFYKVILYVIDKEKYKDYEPSFTSAIGDIYWNRVDLNECLKSFESMKTFSEVLFESDYKQFAALAQDTLSKLRKYIEYMNKYIDKFYKTGTVKTERQRIKDCLIQQRDLLLAMLYNGYKVLEDNGFGNRITIIPGTNFYYIQDTYFVQQPEFYIWDINKKQFVDVEWTYYYYHNGDGDNKKGGYDYIDFLKDNVTSIMKQTTNENRASMNCNSAWYTGPYKKLMEQLPVDEANPIVQPTELDAYIPKDWRTEIILEGLQSGFVGNEQSQYYAELLANWPVIYDLKKQVFKTATKTSDDYYSNDQVVLNSLSSSVISYKNIDGESVELVAEDKDGAALSQGKTENENDTLIINTGYVDNRIVGSYFLDILDASTSKWGEYSVSNIGCRRIVVKDDEVNCLFAQDPPDFGFIFVSNSVDEDERIRIQEEENLLKANGYSSPLRVNSDIYSHFSTGGGNKGAYDTLRYNLMTHTDYQEQVNISLAKPIFYLKPNTLIEIREPVSGTIGKYEIKTISLPLAVNQQMSITAAKAIRRI